MGLKLVSGGLDTDLVICDVVAQVGKCRLSGHSNAITDCCFMEKYKDIVISSSKDSHIKFWNIETQFCFKTLVDHRAEVWGLALMRDDTFLVAGSKENTLRVYKINENQSHKDNFINLDISSMLQADDDSLSPFKCNFVGTIQRSGKGRTINLVSDVQRQVLGCSGQDDEIELFYFCTTEESIQRLTKRLKKVSLKKDVETSKEISLTDEIRRITSIKTKEKVKSFDLLLSSTNELRIGTTFANNLVRMYSLDIHEKHPEHKLVRSITQQGHHSECRSVCFSSDNLAIASGSGESLKLWNRSSLACLRTVETEYILSTCFVPGKN